MRLDLAVRTDVATRRAYDQHVQDSGGRGGPLTALTVLGFATILMALGRDYAPYWLVFAAAVAIQVGLCVTLWFITRTLLSICTIVIASWLVYFTLRMVGIGLFTDPIYDHIAVSQASDELRSEIWIGTTVVLLAFVLGMTLVRSWTAQRFASESGPLMPGILRVIALVGLAGYSLSSVLGLQSGILANAFQLYLFSVAALSYGMARDRRINPIDGIIVLLAVAIGPLSNFKEPAVIAILAVLVGYLASGAKVRPSLVVVSAIAALVAFSTVQAQRIISEETGTEASIVDVPSNVVASLTQYDLAHGVAQEQNGLEVLANPFFGVLKRVQGADALFALRAKIPDQVDYESGKSILQPVLATIPAVDSLFDLEYNQLSLGRYYNYNFWSYRPDEDTSSQGITVPGDLFLNWGWPGAVIGLGLMGGLLGWLDRRFPARSALGAGLFAYAFLPLLALERGVAYQLVTLGIRLVIGLILVRALGGKWVREAEETPTNRSESVLA